MTILWSFSYNSFVKFCGKKNGRHNTIVFYPNQCYSKAWYKGTTLYVKFLLVFYKVNFYCRSYQGSSCQNLKTQRKGK